MLPYIVVFGLKIDMYAVCVTVGMLCVALLFRKLYKRRGIDGFKLAICSLFVLVGLFLGAHLLYGITNTEFVIDVLSNPKAYIGSFSDFVSFMDAAFGGLVFYGGMIGGLLFGLLYVSAAKLPKGDYLDLFAPTIPLFHAFGRLGCFCSGCCHGIESKFGFVADSKFADVSDVADGISRFPVQLLECALNFILAYVLTVMFKKEIKKGRLIRVYFFTYPVIRFFDEFLRGDEIRGFLGPLSTSQWISLALFLFAVAWLIVEKIKTKNTK